MTRSPIRVLVIEDQPLVRRGVVSLLEEAPDIEPVGETETRAEALAATAHLRPDVVLLDLEGTDSLAAIRSLLLCHPAVRILALSEGEADARALAAVEAGAYGYVRKSGPVSELVHSIRQVHSGDPALPSVGMRSLLARLHSARGGAPAPETLSPRETEVLALLASGLGDRDIADRLHIAEVTVRSHVSHILDKLGVENRIAAVLHALRTGVAPLESPGSTVVELESTKPGFKLHLLRTKKSADSG